MKKLILICLGMVFTSQFYAQNANSGVVSEAKKEKGVLEKKKLEQKAEDKSVVEKRVFHTKKDLKNNKDGTTTKRTFFTKKEFVQNNNSENKANAAKNNAEDKSVVEKRVFHTKKDLKNNKEGTTAKRTFYTKEEFVKNNNSENKAEVAKNNALAKEAKVKATANEKAEKAKDNGKSVFTGVKGGK